MMMMNIMRPNETGMKSKYSFTMSLVANLTQESPSNLEKEEVTYSQELKSSFLFLPSAQQQDIERDQFCTTRQPGVDLLDL